MTYNWEQAISGSMIAVGMVLVLVGLLAWNRHRKPAESEDGETMAEPPRPRMPPLPRLLSPERSGQADDSKDD